MEIAHKTVNWGIKGKFLFPEFFGNLSFMKLCKAACTLLKFTFYRYCRVNLEEIVGGVDMIVHIDL